MRELVEAPCSEECAGQAPGTPWGTRRATNHRRGPRDAELARSVQPCVRIQPRWWQGWRTILSLGYRRFDENPGVTQAAILENKGLGVALAAIQSAQIARDRKRVESKRLTLRTKARIKAAREEA